MADGSRRWPQNVSGDFFVDRTCIDCDQCREIAPGTFGDAPGHASVYRQPDSPELERRALMALVACPVGSIGAGQRHNLNTAVEAFPEPIEDNVYFCGFASADSFGASSYLIVQPEGNVLSRKSNLDTVEGVSGNGVENRTMCLLPESCEKVPR